MFGNVDRKKKAIAKSQKKKKIHKMIIVCHSLCSEQDIGNIIN